MPRKDPESRRRYMIEYRERKIAEGYGRTLYLRRKVRWENELRYREAMDKAIELLNKGKGDEAKLVLFRAIVAAEKAIEETP